MCSAILKSIENIGKHLENQMVKSKEEDVHKENLGFYRHKADVYLTVVSTRVSTTLLMG